MGGGGGGWRGGGWRGGVLPKRLKSGSGHHRLESYGPSNGRHKITEDRRDFFDLLRSLPSAIALMHLIPSMSPMLSAVSS